MLKRYFYSPYITEIGQQLYFLYDILFILGINSLTNLSIVNSCPVFVVVLLRDACCICNHHY